VTVAAGALYFIQILDDNRRISAVVAVESQTDMTVSGTIVWRRKGAAGQPWAETRRMIRIGYSDRPARYDFTMKFQPDQLT